MTEVGNILPCQQHGCHVTRPFLSLRRVESGACMEDECATSQSRVDKDW